jgi:hypothetical protein
MNALHKPLPPYGRRLKDKMLAGWRPTNGVNIFCCWKTARHFLEAVCFPPGADPLQYDWTFLAGQDISLINTSGNCEFEILREVAVLIVQSGAARVGLVDAEHPLEWFVPGTEAQAA